MIKDNTMKKSITATTQKEIQPATDKDIGFDFML